MSPQPLRSPLVLASLFVFLGSLSFNAPAASAWQFTESAGSGAFEQAEAVGVDERTGHVVAAGTIHRSSSGFVFFAVKVNRQHGHEIWRFSLPDSEPGRVRALALDPDGHVILAGEAGPPSSAGGQLTVVKLDGELGTPHWVARIPGGGALDVAVDAAGDVIAAGTLGRAMGVVKLSGGDGAELWRARPSGATPGGQVRALALDAAGDAVVAGFTRNADSRNAFTVVKLGGSDGAELWRHAIEPHRFSGTDEAIAVAVDPFGDAVAAGSVRLFDEEANALPAEFTVVKLAGADGSLAWRRDLSPSGRSDLARGLALDAAGDVIAVGSLGTDAGFRPAVVKLSGADGSDLWRRLFEEGSTDPVTVDAAGDVIAAGVVFGTTRFDIVVRKLVGATGDTVWTTVVNGPGDGDDSARAVATDDAGDVVVGGGLHGGASGPDFAVLKLDGATGDDFRWPDDLR